MAQTPDATESLTDFMHEFFEHCILELNMPLPVHVMTVSANGQVVVTRIFDNGDDTTGTEHVCERLNGDMQLPLIITAVSADGHGASAQIASGGMKLLQ